MASPCGAGGYGRLTAAGCVERLCSLTLKGEGIAFGDEYIVSVTGLAFVSLVLHGGEPEPPSLGRGWRRRRRRIGASGLLQDIRIYPQGFAQLLSEKGACVTELPSFGELAPSGGFSLARRAIVWFSRPLATSCQPQYNREISPLPLRCGRNDNVSRPPDLRSQPLRGCAPSPFRTVGPKGRQPSPLKGKRLTMICASLCSFKSCSLCTPEACPHLREAAINSSSAERALSASIRFFSFFGTRFSKGGMRPKFTFMGWKFFPSK